MGARESVRVRFAPSPTGELHLGGARTALFNYLFARQAGGEFFLRIEDTDVLRSKTEFVDQICDSLKWLGLDWDGDIVYQSRRGRVYESGAARLLENGLAYACFCPADDLSREREEAIRIHGRYQYSGRCRSLSPEESLGRVAANTPHCLRIRVPEGVTWFEDAVYGKISVDNKEIDDFILCRTDGAPTYNFSVVVDDLEMSITHVIRGEDHIANTPKQIVIYRALGSEPPSFGHLPMILGSANQRLSKRHGATGVQSYREMGYLPEALLNYLALLGWSPGDDREFFTRAELLREFSLAKIARKGAIFDQKKLHWVSSQHMAHAPAQELLSAVESTHRGWGEGADQAYRLRVIDLVKSRTKSLEELHAFTEYFFEDPVRFDEETVRKRWSDGSVNGGVDRYRGSLEGVESWDAATVEECLKGTAVELGVSTASLIHPTRLAVTGFGIGPPLYDVMELLGKDRVVRRLKFAIENLPPA